MQSERTALYRHFDNCGTLLYVGISHHHLKRLHEHSTRAGWGHLIASQTIEYFSTRLEAERAERKAISNELPRYNIIFNKARNQSQSLPTIKKVLRPPLDEEIIRNLQVDGYSKDRIIFDSRCKGLAVRVTSNGSKIFLAQWTDPTTKRKVRSRIGLCEHLSLSKARSETRLRISKALRSRPYASRASRYTSSDLQLNLRL